MIGACSSDDPGIGEVGPLLGEVAGGEGDVLVRDGDVVRAGDDEGVVVSRLDVGAGIVGSAVAEDGAEVTDGDGSTLTGPAPGGRRAYRTPVAPTATRPASSPPGAAVKRSSTR